MLRIEFPSIDQAANDLDSTTQRNAVHGLPLQNARVYNYIYERRIVNIGIYKVDFREATDGLCERIDHDDIAKALGVSVQTVRQARLGSSTKARREPPREWRDAVIRLAEERVWHYRKLIEEIRRDRREATS